MSEPHIPAAEMKRRLRALPFADFDAILPDAFLVLAPHPDDESLGCGGLIAEACARNRPPMVAILTDGGASHPGSRRYPPARLAALREREAADAVAALGLPPDRLRFMRLPDTRAPRDGKGMRAAAAALAGIAAAHGCGAILTSWAADPHCDHLAAARIAARAAISLGCRLWAYPVWAWLLPDDAPAPLPPSGHRLEIGRHLPRKAQAIAAHASQYAGLIDDDPGGFQLPKALLAQFREPYEVLLSLPVDHAPA